MKVLIVLLLISSTTAFAGWFSGPTKADKEKVKLSYSAGCKDGYIGVRFWNDSKYTVTKVTFQIKGQIDGRSTIYDINNNATSDKILNQFEKYEGCWPLTGDSPPDSYRPIFQVDSIEFLDGKETETVY